MNKAEKAALQRAQADGMAKYEALVKKKKSGPVSDTEELWLKVWELERQLEAVKVPNSFVVIALLPLSPKLPEEIATLAPGERAGLPTIKHNWYCDPGPCRGAGNTVWRKGLDPATGDVPADWKWGYVASRSFASPYEADLWLANSTEGALITKHASIVFVAAVTDYSRV